MVAVGSWAGKMGREGGMGGRGGAEWEERRRGIEIRQTRWWKLYVANSEMTTLLQITPERYWTTFLFVLFPNPAIKR